MDCFKVQELLSQYIDGVLDDDMSGKIKKHIESCNECSREYELLKSIVNECSKFEEVDLPSDFNRKLHERVILEKDSLKNKDRFIWMKKYYKVAAVFLVLAVSLSMVINSSIFNFNKKYTTQENADIYNTAADESSKNDVESSLKIAGTIEEDCKEKGDIVSDVYYNILITLSEDIYEQLYDKIVFEIESLNGYMKQNNPPVYMMPQESMETFIRKMDENYNINDIDVSVVDIAQESKKLNSQIDTLKELQNQYGEDNYVKNEIDINAEIAEKENELKELYSLSGNVLIKIERYK